MIKISRQRWVRLGIFLGVFLLSIGSAFAQSRTVKGKVVDQNNRPLSDVTVRIKGTTTGVLSDVNGNYSVTASSNNVLSFFFVGYETVEETVGSRSVIDVTMTESAVQMKDVVVVGYGTQTKENLTGAVSTVDIGKSLEAKPFTDVAKGLQGTVPGLTITYGSGAVTSTPNINIRGVVSVNGGNVPLILVDGVVISDFSMVSPNDIASISVLKDAASTSIFGARAADGVIMITTKSGAKNTKSRVSYTNNFSIGVPTLIPEFPKDAVGEINTEVAAFLRQGSSFDMFGMEAPELIAGIQNWQDKYSKNRKSDNMIKGEDFDISDKKITYFYRIWDPVKMMYQNMPQTNHNIRISGGTDKLSYFLSGTYSYQEGLLKIHPDKLSKYNLTAGFNADVNKWLNIDTKMSMYQSNFDYPYGYQDYFYYMWRWGAYFPYGTYTDPSSGQNYYFRNVNGFLANASNCTYDQNIHNLNLAATIKLTPDLKLRSEFSYMTQNGTRHETGGLISLWDFWGAGGLTLNSALPGPSYNETDYTSSLTTQLTTNSYITYEKKFGLHYVKAMAGINAEKGEFVQQFSKGYGLMDNSMGEIALVTNSTTPVITSTSTTYAPAHTWWSVAGYFARLNYSYNNRYLIELNGRYDGSSNFPVSGRWAFFPSGSVGWRLTEEPFMEGLKDVVSDWKIRGSYGTIGNQNIGANKFLPLMNTAQNNWIVGSIKATYTGMPQTVASSLTWEKINSLDFGTDLRLLNNNLGLTFDWFRRDNVGTVSYTATMPSTFGTSASMTNVGNMRTNGWELAVDYRYRLENGIQLYANAALSNYTTVITKWGGNSAKSLTKFYSGQTYGEIWGFKTAGFFKDAADVANSPSQTLLQSGSFAFGQGDIKYADLNDDKKIDGGALTASDHGDLVKIGNNTPKYQYSLRLGGDWKGFDLDIYLQGVGKRDYWATGSIAIPGYSGSSIFLEHQMDYWTPTNTDAKYPTPYQGNSSTNLSRDDIWSGNTSGTSGNNFYPQTKYLLNLAYLRLKDLTAGYTIPANISKKVGLEKCRIYVDGTNLLTFSENKIPIDPEITDKSSTGSWYGATTPFTKTYSFGVQVSF